MGAMSQAFSGLGSPQSFKGAKGIGQLGMMGKAMGAGGGMGGGKPQGIQMSPEARAGFEQGTPPKPTGVAPFPGSGDMSPAMRQATQAATGGMAQAGGAPGAMGGLAQAGAAAGGALGGGFGQPKPGGGGQPGVPGFQGKPGVQSMLRRLQGQLGGGFGGGRSFGRFGGGVEGGFGGRGYPGPMPQLQLQNDGGVPKGDGSGGPGPVGTDQIPGQGGGDGMAHPHVMPNPPGMGYGPALPQPLTPQSAMGFRGPGGFHVPRGGYQQY